MNRNRNQKYTYEEVKEYIESFGYKLLSEEYVNANNKLLILCDKGHEYMASFSKFKNGNRRCPYCYEEHRGECLKLSYKDVKEYIESFGYKLLSNEYVNSSAKLQLQCPLGHIYNTVRFSSFKNGSRCPECAKERYGEYRKHSYKEVKEYIESFNYTLLSNEYKNCMTKLLIMCPEEHKYEVTFNDFRSGRRCPYCSGKIKHTIEDVKEYIESFGYELLSKEYENNKAKLKVRCPNNHEYKVNFSDFQSGCRCPYCNVSKGEQRIIDWLDKNNIKYIYNESYFSDLIGTGGGLLRPDFIIEDKKIWIEFDGKFHYEKMYENDNYEKIVIHDKIKNQYAKKNDWKLIRIPYWDFENIENILDEVLKNV